MAGTTFRQRLEELIEEVGSAEKLAAEMGISFYTLVDWRRRDSLPSFDTLSKLSDTFGVSLDWLVGKSDVKQLARRKGK